MKFSNVSLEIKITPSNSNMEDDFAIYQANYHVTELHSDRLKYAENRDN